MANAYTMTYANTNYDDITFPATGLNPPGAVSDPGRNTTDGCLDFDAASTELIAGFVHMPHTWKEGSTLYPHIHWSPTSTGGGNVLWRFSYSVADATTGVFPAFTDVDVLAAAGTVSAKQLNTGFGTIVMTGQKIGRGVKWTLARIGGDGTDTYGADAKLLELDFHYEIDSVGSGALWEK
jgi:hypothetical protein